MLEAGIDIVYIRDFLGHEDVSTTMVYLRTHNRLKRNAVNELAPKVTNDKDLPDWNDDKDLMEFLNSLK
jgi:integrase